MTITNDTVTVARPVRCYFCFEYVQAEYDFKTRRGPWAYGCAKHWEELRAYDSLGMGKGQRLVVSSGLS